MKDFYFIELMYICKTRVKIIEIKSNLTKNYEHAILTKNVYFINKL